MNLIGLSIITILGLLLAIAGAIGVIYYVLRYRRTRDQFEEGEDGESDAPPNTLASIWLVNGFLHIGMLLLILGGVGLIFYGQR